MLICLKTLFSLVMEAVFAVAGGLLAAGIAWISLRADESGPGAGVVVLFFGLIGLALGSIFGAAGIVMLWRRIKLPLQPLPSGQGETLEGVWPPPPSSRKS